MPQAINPSDMSSNPADPDDDPTIYPTTRTWLTDLDSGSRGADGQCFTQFSDALELNGYSRIIQIADEAESGVKEFASLFDGMPIGVAKLLVKYAVKDCKKIQKAIRKNHRNTTALT